MFQLIVSIIAIALVAVLAAASIFYGGDAFTSGTAKANASAAVNVAQQVTAAWTLYRTDVGGTDPSPLTTAPLISASYLQGAPSLPTNVSALTLSLDLDSVTAGSQPGVSLTTTSSDICKNVQAAGAGVAVNTITTLPTALTATQSYGCYGAGPNYTIFYKR